MRNVAKSMLAAAVAAVGFAGMAGANSLFPNEPSYTGPVVIKYTNFDEGTVYTPIPAAPVVGAALVDALPQTGLSNTSIAGQDAWGILRVATIEKPNGFKLYDGGTAAFEITGIFWGGVDTYVAPGLFPATEDIHAVGVHIAFFTDVAKDFDSTGGPLAAGALAGGLPVYPTVTNGGPAVLTANSVPGFDPAFPTDEFFTTYSPTATIPGLGVKAFGGMALEFGAVPHWGTGTHNTEFAALPGADALAKFTGQPGGDGWLLRSDDPVDATAIPTPSAAWGGALLAGLLGVNVIRRRRAL